MNEEEEKPFDEMDVVEQINYLHKYARKQEFMDDEENNQVNTLDFDENND